MSFMPKDPLSRRAIWLRRALLLSGSLAFSFLILEVGLWMIGFEFPVTTARHPHRGYSNRPNAEWIQRSEGFASVSTNSRGFRDAEWAIAKPAGTIRIAVLGDSFTEATQVAEEERFTELLEMQLREKRLFEGRKIEVMNFGSSGYGTAQQLMAWRHDVRQYKPDFVVLAFLSGNDIRNNSEKLEGDPIRPYFVEQNGQLVLDDSFRNQQLPLVRSIGLRAARYSRVAQVAYQVSRGIRAKRKLQQLKQTSPAEAKVVELGLAEPGLSTWIYSPPTDDEHKTAWQITEKLISQLNQEVSQSGAQLFVVSLTNAIQVHPNEESRKQFAKLLDLKDVRYPDRRIAQHCQRNGIPILSLVPGMQAHAQKYDQFLHGFENTTPGQGHWNAAGHLVAGSLMGDWLEQEFARPTSGLQTVSHEE
jgi:lysophospholipase L1-like esterase